MGSRGHCRKHYEPRAHYVFLNFGADLRYGRCRYCEAEDREQWLSDVQHELEFCLMLAAHGRPFTWRPSRDTPESILAYMMELRNAPATLEETIRWVRKYLTERQEA
jgi:hypothetical protein